MDTFQFNNVLSAFKINANCEAIHHTDNYCFYDVKLKPSATVKEIQKHIDEISLALKKPCRPSIKILHSLGIVRLEFAVAGNNSLKLFDLFTNAEVPSGGLITLLGQSVDGKKVWMDLSQNPHMIVAGTTGSGKSTLLHNIIANMINYNDCIMYLSDSKNVEFHQYASKFKNNITVASSYEDTIFMINSLIYTMEERYNKIRSGASISDLPFILLIIDEFADLILQDKNDQFFISLCRLAQKCRAARISIILSTQRPSVNVISGIIKANFPARIACKVASHIDSKVILDTTGAENLLGKGDALLKDNFRHMERFQVAYTDATEVCKYFG